MILPLGGLAHMLRKYKKAILVPILTTLSLLVGVGSALAKPSPEDEIKIAPISAYGINIKEGESHDTVTWKQIGNSSNVTVLVSCANTSGLTSKREEAELQIEVLDHQGKAVSKSQTVPCTKVYKSNNYKTAYFSGLKLKHKLQYKIRFTAVVKKQITNQLSEPFVEYEVKPIATNEFSEEKPKSSKGNKNSNNKNGNSKTSPINEPAELPNQCEKIKRKGKMAVFPGAECFVLGQKSPYVTELGKMLVAAKKNGSKHNNYYKIGPGPIFTDADRQSLRSFQLSNRDLAGLPDGYPGPITWELLAKAAGYKK